MNFKSLESPFVRQSQLVLLGRCNKIGFRHSGARLSKGGEVRGIGRRPWEIRVSLRSRGILPTNQLSNSEQGRKLDQSHIQEVRSRVNYDRIT
jgi:hypothetical protein